ncbi:hypothetical protein ACLI4U_07365 [Natrialbaceae archaeon A-CW2]|uniref:hypothetical protein n=1 Tax=Natronosalvus amylolyticus TaxID=2961994 RepID=UPI0020C94B0D|nr:hypothetical protein [Natronosalvus amylolyticus]
MIEVPLQTIDNIMLELHMGHALIGLLVLAILGTLPLKSMKIMGLNLMLVGSLFVLTPVSTTGDMVIFRLIGVALVMVGPMLYFIGR